MVICPHCKFFKMPNHARVCARCWKAGIRMARKPPIEQGPEHKLQGKVLRNGWPDKVVGNHMVEEKWFTDRMRLSQRAMHDWLFNRFGVYPLVEYHDADGNEHIFQSYKDFEIFISQHTDVKGEDSELAETQSTLNGEVKEEDRTNKRS